MNTYLQLANFLQFFVVAGFWIFVLGKMIPEWRLDSFRQNLFIDRTLCHVLFLLASWVGPCILDTQGRLSVFRRLPTPAASPVRPCRDPD